MYALPWSYSTVDWTRWRHKTTAQSVPRLGLASGLAPARAGPDYSGGIFSHDNWLFATILLWKNTTNSWMKITGKATLKSTSVSVCFRGISRLPSAFVFLRWFKLAHISIQVCTFHDGCKQGIDQQIFFYLNKDFSANSIWIRTEDA